MAVCPKCGAPEQWSTERCPSCGHALGFPNVRAAANPAERAALAARLHNAETRAESNHLTAEFQRLIDAVNDSSNIVVSMSAEVALHLVSSDAGQYVNYEKLVGSTARAPAAFANDSQRAVVMGAMFGSYGGEIRYGALSLSNRGLATYGDIYCTLKRIAVEERTSFLEINSYEFVNKYGPENHPAGFRADWPNRAKLAAIKLLENGSLRPGQSAKDWEPSLLVSDGKNRNLDDYVEAHIFGTFNLYSIEKIAAAGSLPRNRQKLVDVVLEAFGSISGMRAS
jgi:hypothetical protein